MSTTRLFSSTAVIAGLCAAVLVSAQRPPIPKPAAEHEVLELDEGTWDAVLELVPGPGAPPTTSKGVEVNTMGCGGLCLITDFNGQIMPGVAFQGHGVMTWEAAQKKYRGSWTDSTLRGLATTEGTWDGRPSGSVGGWKRLT